MQAARDSLNRTYSSISSDGIKNYTLYLFQLVTDLYPLVAYAEKKYNDQLPKQQSKRYTQQPHEIFAASKISFNSEAYQIESIRGTSPVSIFLLRQTIETLGYKSLGVASILDGNGKDARIRNTTPWDFIKSNPSHFQLAIDIHVILRIEEWTNYYVHSGNIPPVWLTETAINMLEPLFIHPPVLDYRGVTKSPTESGIRITNYDTVKLDFEAHIKSIDVDYIVEWSSIEQVVSAILSR